MNASPSSPASTESLVEALATRLHMVDLTAWARITARAEELGLSFEDLRLLLALKIRGGGPSSVSELAHSSGFSLDAAYPAFHRLRSRGYVSEERRRYSFTEEGRELVALLDTAHQEGIQEYVDGLDASERESLERAVGLLRQEIGS